MLHLRGDRGGGFVVVPVEVRVDRRRAHLGGAGVPLVVLLLGAGGRIQPNGQGEGGLGGVVGACG